MKKLLAILFAVALILCFTVPSFAEEEAPEIEEEITEAPEEITEEPAEEATEIAEPADEGGKLDYLIEKLTSTSFWITIVSVLGSGSAVIVLVRKKFTDIIILIKQKADAKAIKECLENARKEIAAEYAKEKAELTAKIDAQGSQINQLCAILSVYIVNTVKNPATRAEILKMVSGLNECTGTVAEIVEQVTEAIEEATKEEPKEETPALDALIVDGGM